MILSLVTGPASEPITPDEVKLWAALPDVTDFDQPLDQLITAVREQTENALGLAYLTQTWDQFLDGFPASSASNPWGAIDLGRTPVQATGFSISYVDAAGVTQTLAAANYTLDVSKKPARVYPAYGLYWPATRGQPNAVTVRFTAGYGVGPTSVPKRLLQALSIRVATMYEHRQSHDNEEWRELPFTQRQLEAEDRLWP